MRRIDLRKLSPNPEWLKQAGDMQNLVNEGTKKPSDAGPIWRALKPELMELSFDKCWYCESCETRSDNTVDHFRPKSIYPWCCCEHDNFRFACTMCNSRRTDRATGETGGKGNSFPLESGEPATNAAERNNEPYLLIDPCVPADVILLDFVDDGRALPRRPDKVLDNKRAVLSIQAYHLNHSDLVEERRRLALQIEEWINNAEELRAELDPSNMSVQKTYETLISDIGRSIASDAPYSVFAKKMVKGYRYYDWVDDLLDCA